MSHWINGRWQDGQGEAFQSTDPVYQTLLWQGQAASPLQVHQAVAAAAQAFEPWRDRAFEERLAILKTFHQLLDLRQADLALKLAQETGKPLWEAKTEIAAMVGKLAFSSQAYQERTGHKESTTAIGQSVLRHRPLGVLAVFGPFNFPGHLPNGHITPALLAGNTIVFKPSEQTPRFAEIMVKLWEEAGLPPGVLNLVQGQAATGKALAGSPVIAGLLFTGSCRVGKLLHQQFAGQPDKLLALEMGGNNPLIVHGVKDPRAAAYHTIQSSFLTAGQRCVCARRLIVPQGAEGDEFVRTLVAMTQNIVVGPYDADPQPFMGSLISAHAAQHMLNVQTQWLEQGATSLLAMRPLKPGTGLVTPGIIDVTALAQREDEEHFGPLLQVIRVANFDAAIAEANHTQYGLAAAIFTDNRAHYEHYLNRARAGVVNWNRQTTGASGAAPFGGLGLSGNHRPSGYYAADYCAYPVASIEVEQCVLPSAPSPGLSLL